MNKCIALLLAVLLLGTLCCCGYGTDNAAEQTIRAGVYELVLDDDNAVAEEKAAGYVSIPSLSINTGKGTFDLEYDPLSSYRPSGFYTVSGSLLICETDDGLYTYTFTIIDSEHISFNASLSDELCVYSDAIAPEIVDGAVFNYIN